MQVILNGKLLDSLFASIHLSDRGLLLADGLFETIRIHQGEVIFFDLHWERLVNSLKKLFIPCPFSKIELLNFIHELIAVQKSEQNEWSARLTITRGEGMRGINFPDKINPNYFITLSPRLPPKQNISLNVASARRNEYSSLSQIKSLHYLDNILARQQALSLGVDDAIFLNTNNKLTEATTANIFVVIKQKIYTPPVSDGLIPGIIRSVLLREAPRIGLPIIEKTLTLEELSLASEVFLTNVLVGMQRVTTIKDYFQVQEDKYFCLLKTLAHGD